MQGFELIVETFGIIELFQTALVPILMFSGIGLFILIIQIRYGRVVDIIRTLNNERLELIKKDIMSNISKIEKKWNDYRLQDLQKQVSILVKRGKLLKNALQFMFLAIFTSILSSSLLFITQLIGMSLATVIVLIFAFGMVLVFIGCLFVIKEVTSSYSAVMFDIDTHVPREYRLKTEFGVLGDLEEGRKLEESDEKTKRAR